MIQQETLAPIYARYQQQNPNEVWIDVRQPEEWAEGVIPGVKKVMLADLEKTLPTLTPDTTYVLVCRSGNRSNQAAALMQQHNFSSLVNFAGGMLSWYKAKYPLEKA